MQQTGQLEGMKVSLVSVLKLQKQRSTTACSQASPDGICLPEGPTGRLHCPLPQHTPEGWPLALPLSSPDALHGLLP